MTTNPIFLTEAFDPSKSMEIAEALPYGLQTALLGMCVIFSVLIILWGVLAIFKLIFYKGDKKDKAPAAPSTPAPTAAPEAAEPELTPIYSEQDDAEIVAAITAAIAVMMDAPETSFRVVSFRRTAKK